MSEKPAKTSLPARTTLTLKRKPSVSAETGSSAKPKRSRAGARARQVAQTTLRSRDKAVPPQSIEQTAHRSVSAQPRHRTLRAQSPDIHPVFALEILE